MIASRLHLLSIRSTSRVADGVRPPCFARMTRGAATGARARDASVARGDSDHASPRVDRLELGFFSTEYAVPTVWACKRYTEAAPSRLPALDTDNFVHGARSAEVGAARTSHSRYGVLRQRGHGDRFTSSAPTGGDRRGRFAGSIARSPEPRSSLILGGPPHEPSGLEGHPRRLLREHDRRAQPRPHLPGDRRRRLAPRRHVPLGARAAGEGRRHRRGVDVGARSGLPVSTRLGPREPPG